MEEFEKLLKNHDWYFEYSDDQRVWHAGRTEKGEIQSVFQKLKQTDHRDAAIELYEKYKK